MPKTIYLDDQFLNAALRGIPFIPPTAVYAALYTAAPGVAGGGMEVVGGSYARPLVIFTPPANGRVESVADVLFPVATAPWGTIVAFAFLDTSFGGNMLYFANLSSSRMIDISDQVRFAAGQLVCVES